MYGGSIPSEASTRNVRRSALTFKNYLKTGSCSESPGKRRASCAYGAKRARPRYAEVAHHVGSSPRSTKSRSALRLQLLAIAFNACAGGPAGRRCVRRLEQAAPRYPQSPRREDFTDNRLGEIGRGRHGSYGRGGDAAGSAIRRPRAGCPRRKAVYQGSAEAPSGRFSFAEAFSWSCRALLLRIRR